MKKTLLLACIILSGGILQAQTITPMPIPPQSTTFTGNVRGYWFVAPTCFTITAADVPTDASTGAQSIAILRLEANPPLFSTTTNNFDVLYLTQSNADPDTIGLNILVNQGDIIGVLACRGTVNSYAPANYITNINGFSATLGRLGMQLPLPTNSPQQVWTEPSGSLSRLNLYYDTNMLYQLTYSNVGADYTFANGTDTLYTSLFSVWDYGDGSPLDTAYTPTHTYTANGNYTVCSYIYTGCGIDTICTSINVCFMGATAGFSSSFTGLDATFTDASSNANGWFWNFGDGNTDTVQNPIHSYASMGWYTVTQIVSNNCGANDTITDSLLICTPPAGVAFTTANENTPTTNFIDGSANGVSWNWDFGDGNNSTLQNPTHNYLTNGTYSVCLVVSNLCGADTICNQVTVCPQHPTAHFTQTNSVFNANFTNGSAFATSSLWSFGDGNTSTLDNPSHTYTSAGTYLVCLTSYDDCGDSTVFCDSITIAGNAGIEEITSQQSIHSYPNPSHAQSIIVLNSPEPIEGTLFITDITGKVIHMAYSGLFMQGESKYTLQTGIWPSGIYMLVWETNKWKMSKRLIVN